MTHLPPQRPTPPRTAPRPHLGAALAAIVMAGIVGFLGGGLLGAVGFGIPNPAEVVQRAVAPDADTSSEDSAATPSPTISLEADRREAARNQRIQLTGGTSPPAAGTTLDVQRSQDGGPFQLFPVSVVTDAQGEFYTEVATQQTGESLFRVFGEVAGERIASNAVPVTIR